jgi:hypothetical protein
LQALDDDPKLLAVRPTPPSTGLNHLKPFNVSTVLIAVHKDSYTSLKLTNKAASTGGRHKSCAAWRFFADDPERVASITSRTWATVNP